MENKTKVLESTDSTLFLLPCFGIPYKELKELGFINCYIADKHRTKVNERDTHLYLLFRPDPKQALNLIIKIAKLEQQDIDHSVLLEDYNYEDGYTVLVFKFPDRFKKDYDKFLNGKYSRFSKEFQETFPENKVIQFTNEFNKIEKLAGKSTQWMIINKDPRIKRFVESKYDGISLDEAPEYWHMPIMEKETLDIDQIQKELEWSN